MCTLDDCYSSNLTKRWHGGPENVLLVLNDISTNINKYRTEIEKEHYMLIIKKLTIKDLNVSYTCSCGFQQKTKILSENEVFHRHTVGTSGVNSSDVTNLSTDVILGTVIPIVVFSIIIGLVYVLQRKGKLKNVKQLCNGQCGHRYNETDLENPDITLGNLGLPNEHDILLTDDDNIVNDQAESDLSIPTENNSLLPGAEDSAVDQIDSDFSQTCSGLHSYSQINNISPTLLPQENRYSNQNNGSLANNECSLFTDNETENQAKCSTDQAFQHISSTRKIEDDQAEVCYVFHSSKENITRNGSYDSGRRPDKTFQLSLPNDQNINSSGTTKMTCPEYKTMDIRICSYCNDWKLSSPTVINMAEAGFFYLGFETLARCFCCGSKKQFQEGDNPLDRSFHKDCQYISQTTPVSVEKSPEDPDETIPMTIVQSDT